VMKMSEKKINILYVIWSLGLGGAERVVIDLAKGLDRSRFQPFICCLNEEGTFAKELKDSLIQIFELNKKAGLDFSVIGKIVRIIKDHNIHLVHTHLWGANVWGRVAGFKAQVPVVVTEHNIDVWKRWYHRWIDRRLAPKTNKICVVSEKVKQFYINHVHLSSSKLQVVYNGIKLSEKNSDAAHVQKIKNEFNIKDGSPILANIGRLVEAKANHIFIRALEELDRRAVEFHALMIGDGPLKEALTAQGQALIRKNKLTLTGLRKDVQQILDIVDVAVLSSTREGFSIVVLECMAKGIPFVATDVGGNREQVVDGKTGFIVDVNQPLPLAQAISKIIQDSGLASRIGENARQRAREYFSIERMVQTTQEIYAQALGEGAL